MRARPRIALLLSLAAASAITPIVYANTPVVVQNEAGFEGLETPGVIYYPATNTFASEPNDGFQAHIDEGGSMFRDQLRNNYSTLGWWDGDRTTTNTDRQRSEAKGIVGLGHQQVEQTFEYSFDFRTSPTFMATGDFCHIFQLKATNGDDGGPLATISLYKNGSGISGRVDSFTDGNGTGGTSEATTAPFSYTAGQWIHFDIRITPCAVGESTGQVLLSVNGGAFVGITNAAIDLTGSTDYRPKFGLYRGISTTDGVPAGVSWVEHRTITGYFGTSNTLTWQGGTSNNTWDTGTTANFLNAGNATVFNTIDQVNFTGATNTTINLAGSVWPGFAYVNSSANYVFQGTGSITGGTLRKDGTGNLTLATSNSYPGLTDVRAGTLYVTGSIGNNTLASVTGGTLKLGAANALGTNNTAATDGTQINGGTLDLNSFAIGTEPVSVQGTGVSNAGAIINSGANQTTAMSNVTLTGNTTFGGTGRWDIRGTGATLSTGGSAFNLTKTGTNQVSLVGTAVDAALANITITSGELGFQTSTTSMGDPTKTMSISPAGILELYGATNTLTKQISVNGGTVWGESGSAAQNNLAGNMTVTSLGGTLDAGSALTGGTANAGANLNITAKITAAGTIIKNGPGTVTLSNAANSLANVTVNAGTMNLPVPTKVNGLTLAGSTNNWAPAVNVSTLVVETTASSKAAALATLQNQVAYGAGHAVGVDSIAALPANEALAVVDNGSLAVPLGSYANMSLDSNSLLVTPLLLGDTNADNHVDPADLNVVLNNFGTTNANWTAGNFDGSATIDLTDLADVLNNFGLSTPGASVAVGQAAAVPEPGTAALVAMALPALLRRRRARG